MPQTVDCGGCRYELIETFKHDFFAATGAYRSESGQLAVLKIGRESSLLAIPMAWIGRWLARREFRMYQLVSDLSGVPALVGMVGRNGLMHAFVPGRALGRDDQVDDQFFARLAELLTALHARGIAYVDLNKRQNILLGDDGRPYLIDFQIALYLPPRGLGRFWPARWLLSRFQAADWYHYAKHKRRLRPDLLTPEERTRVERLSVWIRLHRLWARPATQVRRWILRRLRRRETMDVAGSDAK
ncbi:MAG: hypothetical protein CHACPFDD_02015 [Phycisphaerae bacterium]|nr:hypothetical protein [Phycisphaerae bacterium]